MTYNIATICASLAESSSNQQLLTKIAEKASEPLVFTKVDLLPTLPHFSPDFLDNPPQSVLQWRAALSSADAILLAVPEYAHSFPGVLKNGIDWVIYSGELEEKTIAMTANVPHSSRGEKGLLALSSCLAAVKANVFWEQTIIDFEDKAIAELLDRLNKALTQS